MVSLTCLGESRNLANHDMIFGESHNLEHGHALDHNNNLGHGENHALDLGSVHEHNLGLGETHDYEPAMEPIDEHEFRLAQKHDQEGDDGQTYEHDHKPSMDKKPEHDELSLPNYRPYYGSMLPYSSQAPPHYSSTPMRNENVPNVGLNKFPEFSTQMALGGISGGHEATPNAKDSTLTRRKHPNWTTDQNLVLISGWIKYRTDSVVGRNQKSDSYWGKIAYYCNEHCSFDPPRDEVACRNHYNYMNKILNKWAGAYDNAKRMQQSGWSKNDVLAKAHELYSSGKSSRFSLMSEWLAVRDQPRYGSKVGGNTGSGSSGSKRAHESDASGSNSVGSSARPVGRDAAKKKGKEKSKGATLESVNEEWNELKQYKEKELERLDKIAMRQAEANQLLKESIEAKKMKMFMKLSSKEHLDDRSKELLEKLGRDLFGN